MTIQSMFSHPYSERSASTLDRAAVGFSAAAAITIVFNALLTIVKDSSEPLHDAMAKLTGHHWITHGLAVIVVFVVLGLALTRSAEGRPRISDTTLLASIFVASVGGGAAIALWFLLV
jgi:hypothetical protein